GYLYSFVDILSLHTLFRSSTGHQASRHRRLSMSSVISVVAREDFQYPKLLMRALLRGLKDGLQQRRLGKGKWLISRGRWKTEKLDRKSTRLNSSHEWISYA